MKLAFTKAGLNRSVSDAQDIEKKWTLEEAERERQEGKDAKDARRSVDGVMDDMNSFLASLLSSGSSSSIIAPA